MNPSRPYSPTKVCPRTLVLFLLLLAASSVPAAAQSSLSLLSTNSQRTASANGESRVEAVSADGRFVAFTSDATNLMPFPDTNNAPDVFVYDRLQSRVGLVSVSRNSANSYANGPSGRLRPDSTIGFSADGRYLVYESAASDIVHFDTNNAPDVFVFDLAVGVNILVSAKGNDHQAPANGSSFKPAISANGRTVVFLSAASDASPTADTNGKTDVFARRLDTLTTEMVSVNAAGTNAGNEHSSVGFQAPSVSDDGRFVVFESEAGDLVAGDTNGSGPFGTDVFVRDLQSDTTALVSANSAGTGSGNRHSFASGATISADGRFVVFASDATDLVTGIADNNFGTDIFIRDRAANTTALVSVALNGASAGNNLSQFHAVSADGRYVAFTSRASNLVPVDTNNGLEVGGGGIEDVFLRDVQAGTTELVSVNAAGTDSGDSSSFGPVRISRDGRLVFFTSGATNLTTNGDFNNSPELLRRDTQADTTTLISADKFGNAGGVLTHDAHAFVVSNDNRVIAFDSQSSVLTETPDTNGKSDVFAHATPFPTLSVGDASVVEGDAGTTDMVFTVTLAGEANGTVTARAVTVGNTAQDPADFQSVSAQLTFAPGETTKTVAVPVKGDTLYEPDENFTLRLLDITGAAAADDTGTGTIVENDPQPTLSVGDATVTEGDGPGTQVTFTVSLSGPTAFGASFFFTTAGGTATANEDFGPSFGGGSVAPGSTSRTFTVNIVGDTVDEPDETFFFNISNPTNATIADAQGVATIFDDDDNTGAPAFQFLTREHHVTEGAAGIEVVVSRTGDASAPATIEYGTTETQMGPGVGSDRRDYTAAFGRLRFAAGETSKSFTVFITDDLFVELEERFAIELTNPSGGAVLGSPARGVIVIHDNDTAPSSANPSDTTEFFVRQHYRDFLGRDPDAAGLAFWSGGIESCGADIQCREVKRVDTSAAFFLSIEFQETGFLAYRAHKAAFGDLAGRPVPVRLRDFLFDSRLIGDGVIVGTPGWPERLEANKQAYFDEFAARPEFTARYPETMSAAEFVDALNANAGGALSQSERDALAGALAAGSLTRAAVLRAVAEDETLRQAETNKAFVLMQYFGYLRRNPDDPQDTNFDGFFFWLTKLNSFNGNYVEAEMVKAFISSIEYRQRFGQ